MIRDFLARGSELVVRAGIGVAGPVSDGTCCATNLPWRLDERELADALGLERVALVNDFVAVALGILALGSDDLVVLQDGKIDPRGPMAILGAGTGLGEALLLRTDLGGKVKVLPTEGGHTAFAPSNEMEIRLLRFLQGRFGRVSWERLLSGPGIKNIYDFLVAEGEPALPGTTSRFQHEDPGAVIGELGSTGEDPTCRHVLALFAELYGAEAGDFALKTIPSGGLYVAGGIAPRLLPILKSGGFVSAFNNKGRMSSLTANFRVSVVKRVDVGLIGACMAALTGTL
jgi:glucokinase